MIDKMEDKSASITINTTGVIVSCNQNVEELFGYKANELIGQNVAIIVPSPHREKHNTYLQNYLQGGPAKVIGKVRNVGARHKNGSVFPICLQV
jgi:PAS domain S-box-containing protein